jgi:hypothetical protein
MKNLEKLLAFTTWYFTLIYLFPLLLDGLGTLVLHPTIIRDDYTDYTTSTPPHGFEMKYIKNALGNYPTSSPSYSRVTRIAIVDVVDGFSACLTILGTSWTSDRTLVVGVWRCVFREFVDGYYVVFVVLVLGVGSWLPGLLGWEMGGLTFGIWVGLILRINWMFVRWLSVLL